ncbi:Macro domain [uncultured Clostridium sp.]|nr:Macro domain [uncultured Clostridium sp.]
MNFKEETRDLFTVPQGYYLAHCISGDYSLGAGIAAQFVDVYNMRYKLHRNYPIPDGEKFANVGEALLIDNVFNLVTKDRVYHKPTYDTLIKTLEDMKQQCENLDIDKIAMPRIGCGLDDLSWDTVEEIIKKVFEDTDMEILICTL